MTGCKLSLIIRQLARLGLSRLEPTVNTGSASNFVELTRGFPDAVPCYLLNDVHEAVDELYPG